MGETNQPQPDRGAVPGDPGSQGAAAGNADTGHPAEEMASLEVDPSDPREGNWPTPPKVKPSAPTYETEKLRYSKLLEDYAAQLQADREATAATLQADREKETAEYGNYYAVFQAVHNAYLNVAKDSIATIQARAQFVVTAAGAIGTLYTGLLGLVFQLEKDNNRPLPERGIWAGVFLGLAVVLATSYFAYIARAPNKSAYRPDSNPRQDAIGRVYAFLDWANERGMRLRYLLQCAVVSLGVGIAFLPAAFTVINDEFARSLALVGAVAVFGIPLILYLLLEL